MLLLFFNCISATIHGQKLTLNASGESQHTTSVIDSLNYSKSHEDFKSLSSEVDSISKRLIKNGYIDTKLNQIIKENDSTYLAEFYLGDKINAVKIYIKDNFDISILKSAGLKLSESLIEIKFSELETKLATLNQVMAEQGDPFSQLKLNDIKREHSNTLSATLETTSNQKRTIDKIIVKGYEKFPKSYVKHFLKLKTGKSFNLTQIRKRSATLQQLRFAKEVKEPEVLFTNDSTILYIYTEKSKSNNFDGFLGFGTNEGTNKLEFDGYLDLQLTNNLNYGESLSLFYKSDEIDQQTIDINASLPFIFSSPIEINVGLNIFRKDTTFSTTSQFVKINYQINPNHKIGAGIKGINSSNLLSTSFSDLQDYSSNFYNLSYQFIRPQNYDFLFPVNMFFETSFGFGKRDNNSTVIDQTVLEIESFKIFNLNDRNSIFIKAKAVSLFSDNFLDNELYRFGGINSIRGFEENSLVANLYGVINTEYRYRLSNTIYVNSVLDAAYFENDIVDSKTKLFGFGFGFGLLTNAGLFKLNYSSGKTEGQQFKISDSKVHISLTARF
ncbi:POTRA domain-containing protein [Winogradskyella sp. A3E31]|uniref:POTRA domain-containing protein n=1 Tax=Winogradskyella sp. A3E31 TaxID=3349637 RepID=UPI00398B27AB